MTSICDNCERAQELLRLEEAVEQVKDMAQAAELLVARREYERGRRDVLRSIVKLLEEK